VKKGKFVDDEQPKLPLATNDKKRRAPAIAAKCKNCLFFSNAAYKAFKKPCKTLGVKSFSRPCEHFFANPFEFILNDKRHKLIATLIKKYEDDLPGIVAWLNQEIYTRKKKFYYGQPVVVRMLGEDYLTNYAQAWVVSANSEHVFVQGKKFKGTFLHESIILNEDWVRKRAALVKHKKIKDPKAKDYYIISKKRITPKKKELPSKDDFTKTLTAKAKKQSKVIRISVGET